MKTLQEITNYIIGKQIYTQIDSKDYVEWAFQAIENGFDSENIWILAGLNNSDTEERLKYFQKSLADLNFQIPTDQNEILNYFTNQLANNVISGLESVSGLGYSFGSDIVYKLRIVFFLFQIFIVSYSTFLRTVQ